MTQCSLVFDQQPHTYSSDRSKVAYLIGCLQGSAHSWGTVVWEKQGPIVSIYFNCTGEMRKIFDHTVRGKEAQRDCFPSIKDLASLLNLPLSFAVLLRGAAGMMKHFKVCFAMLSVRTSRMSWCHTGSLTDWTNSSSRPSASIIVSVNIGGRKRAR